MKIAYAYPEALPSHQARSLQAASTCVALARQSERLLLYLPAGSGAAVDKICAYYDLEKAGNLVIRPLDKRFGPFSSSRIFNAQLKRALERDQPDVLMTRHVKTAASFCGQQRPLIFEAHEIFALKPQTAARTCQAEAGVLEAADGIFFLSNGLAQTAKDRFDLQACWQVVPSGTRLWPWRPPPLRQPHEPLRLAYVGSSRYTWKGMATLLEAMALLPAEITLEVVGSLHERYRQDPRYAKLLSDGRVLISGHLKPAEALRCLRRAHVAVIPNSASDPNSRLFTCPLKLLEAMAAGIPVVAADLPSLREIVSDAEALLVKPDDPPALASGILALARDPGRCVPMAHRAWQRVQDFSWQQRARKIISLMNRVFGRGSN